MKKLLTALILTLASATASADNFALIENRNKIENKPDLARDVAAMVKASQYRCDSISSFTTIGKGYYRLRCNAYSYTYDVTVKNGHWQVRLRLDR